LTGRNGIGREGWDGMGWDGMGWDVLTGAFTGICPEGTSNFISSGDGAQNPLGSETP